MLRYDGRYVSRLFLFPPSPAIHARNGVEWLFGWCWNETYVYPLAFLAAQLIHQIVGLVEGRDVGVRQHAAVEGPRVRDNLGGVFANVPHVEEDVSYIAIPGNEIELEHTHREIHPRS